MQKRIAPLLLCLLLTGCLSRGDVADNTYVLSFGIERGDTFAYRIVLLAAMPEAGAEEGASMKTEVLSAEARTLFEAIETVNAGLPLTLRFSRTSLILLSEPLAREGEIKELLDFSLGALDIHSNVRIMVADGPLRDVYEGLKSDADPSFSKTMKNIGTLAEQSGTLIDARCRTVREALGSETFDLVLPYLGVNGSDPKPDIVVGEVYPMLGGALAEETARGTTVIGSAVFDGARMVGTLSGRHTLLCGMVRGEFSEGGLTFYEQSVGTLSVRVRKRKRPSVSVGNGKATVTVYLDVTPEYPLSALASSDALEPFLKERIRMELEDTFAALQKRNADAMLLGTRELLNYPFGGEEGWKERYRSLEASFDVQVRLLHPGGAS